MKGSDLWTIGIDEGEEFHVVGTDQVLKLIEENLP